MKRNVLKDYGYTPWGDNMMSVYGIIGRDSDPVVLAKEEEDEIAFFFNPELLTPNREKIVSAVDALLSIGKITGAKLTGLKFGDVRIYLNPLIHRLDTRRMVVKLMAEAIGNPKPHENEAIEI